MGVVAILWDLAAVYGVWVTIHLWKNPTRIVHFQRAFAGLARNPEVRRGMIRSMPMIAASLVCIAVALAIGALGWTGDLAMAAVFGMLIIGVPVFLLLEILVVLLNSPKILVPPHMRSDRGVLHRRSASDDGA